MILANVLGGIICLIFGLIIRTGKANFLIAGFNTMSEQEKSKWNEEAVSKYTGWTLIISSLVLLIGCIPILLCAYPYVSLLVSWGLFVLVVIGGMVYINTSGRFK